MYTMLVSWEPQEALLQAWIDVDNIVVAQMGPTNTTKYPIGHLVNNIMV